MFKHEDGKYDLEERCLIFAKQINKFIKELPKNIINIENGKQLLRSAGSIGANYIEASESLGKKDFGMRIKISRKEAKESEYWLQLIEPIAQHEQYRITLANEAAELRKIFGAIIRKLKP